MRSVSWLHTADLHLGKPIEKWKGTKEEYLIRKEEYRQTFQRMIEKIQEESIPFFFIAGDFFEHGYVTRSLYEFLWEQFSKIPQTMIWISPGNHDPYRADSIYRKESWPDNVHIFGTKWEEHFFPDYGLTIVGKGFSDFHEKKGSLPKVNHQERAILVVHGELMAKEKKSDYFPILEEELSRLELDYVALGHVHQAYSRVLENERKTFVRYPGSPEALSWKETNARTVTIGKMDGEDRQIEYCPIHTRTYEQTSIQLNGMMTKEKILEQLLEIFRQKDHMNYYLIRLEGFISPDWNLEEDLTWLQYQLKRVGYQRVYFENHSLPDLDLESLRKKSHVIACFIQMMEEKMIAASEEEKQIICSAMYKGLEACVRETAS